MSKMNPVVHFEMPANDIQRMTEFYSGVFGWKANMLGPEMGHYVTVATAETDENGRPCQAGTINGGFFPAREGETSFPSIVIAVEDIHEAIKKINEAGGKVLHDPMEIPGVGQFATFIDTEGNRASVLQPNMM